tara:strand:- start:498 stop:956 length:459 start_codon:yes stop_codon:yes gene_type:complete
MSKLLDKRLKMELKEFKKSNLDQITAGPKHIKNMYEWNAIIIAPKDSLYENGVFKLIINFPQDYPFRPPKIEFITKIFHPNINSNGQICLDILKTSWSPALTISKILLSISSLLTDPNFDDPLDISVSKLYKEDIELYKKTVKDYVKKYSEI